MCARADRYTALAKQPIYYTDFTNNYDLNPATGYLAMRTNAESIMQSIRNLVLTNKMERFYQPEIGSKVQSLLFDLNDAPTLDLLLTTIRETITNFEPRARNLGVQIAQVIDENSIAIQITFSMVNIPEPINFLLILERVR